MTLPAAQQRVLDRMEGALQASEPQLASMFTMFARLNAEEPVGAEPLARPRPRRLRWLRAGTTIYAFVLVPVMFAMITIGALLSSRAHSVATCETGYSAGGGGSPWVTRPWCQMTIQKTTASGARLASCAARIPAIRFVTRSGGDPVAPPVPAQAVTAGPPAAC
ncbi:MAG TPA: hypothetical protein VK284_02690 [Streptosporangiaceae bacterium]|nr:hypothetical protein [Streptosporangiaceae bacterium]